MIPRSNLHTHTTFSDGADRAENVILSAIEMGMETLGFSDHSGLPFPTTWCMTPEARDAYHREINRLKAVYGDRIHILLGIEQDLCSGMPDFPYDYVIGSVHCLEVGEENYMVDESAEVLAKAAKQHYQGDYYRMCRHYYEQVAKVVETTGCDMVGHFDLITKFNEGGRLFDEQDPRYLRPAVEALDYLLEKDVIFEINTGAISRGYRRSPYPSTMLLRRIAEKRGRVTLTSDSHAKESLLCSFDAAAHLARASGIGSLYVMTRDGWRAYPL